MAAELLRRVRQRTMTVSPSSRRRRLNLLVFALLALLAVTGCLKSSSKLLGNVTGKVFDSNGHVLRGAKVEVYGNNHTVTTDALGRYSIVGVEPGQHRIVATYGGESVVLVVEIPRGGTLEGADLTFSVIDGLPPIITDVAVSELTENQAVITWITSELADSLVDYATGPVGLGEYVFLASDSAMLTEHAITLIDLHPGQVYHFRVRSRDFAGNEGVSSDYQFQTPSGDAPVAPTAFAIVPPTEMERITLLWSANMEIDLAGYNLYRSDSKDGPFVRVNADPITSIEDPVRYTDEGLHIAWKYYYQVKAVDTAGNESVGTPVLPIVTPGTLAENRIWKVNESPYIIVGDIRVRGGAVLTIEPGVEVKFAQQDSLPDINGGPSVDLIVQGAVSAVGNETSRILFTSAETFPNKAAWGGILFLATNDPNNQLRFVTIMFADTGVRSEGATPVIENSEFGLCGLGLDLGLSTALNIRFNTIRDCDVGLVSANSNVRNNIFIKNGVGAGLLGADRFEHNTVDCLTGVQVANGMPVIKNNVIAYSGTGRALFGIDQTVALATPTIEFNDIYNFAIPFNNVTVATETGNIASDPLYIGGTPFDYHLQTVAAGYASDSPCLTAGENGVQMGRYGP